MFTWKNPALPPESIPRRAEFDSAESTRCRPADAGINIFSRRSSVEHRAINKTRNSSTWSAINRASTAFDGSKEPRNLLRLASIVNAMVARARARTSSSGIPLIASPPGRRSTFDFAAPSRFRDLCKSRGARDSNTRARSRLEIRVHDAFLVVNQRVMPRESSWHPLPPDNAPFTSSGISFQLWCPRSYRNSMLNGFFPFRGNVLCTRWLLGNLELTARILKLISRDVLRNQRWRRRSSKVQSVKRDEEYSRWLGAEIRRVDLNKRSSMVQRVLSLWKKEGNGSCNYTFRNVYEPVDARRLINIIHRYVFKKGDHFL